MEGNSTRLLARRLRATALCLALLGSPMKSSATLGDCAQPSSNGTAPTASDCLYILKVAVGSATCSPQCVCAPKGILPTSASDALLCLRKAVGQAATLACPCAVEGSHGDDFDDNVKDTEKWGADEVHGNGLLVEVDQRLEYSCESATADDDGIRPWILDRLPYDAAWAIQLDVVNVTVSTEAQQVNGFGIKVGSPQTAASAISAELYMHGGVPYPIHGFRTDLETDNTVAASSDTGRLRVTNGAVRLSFDSSDKVIHVFYDLENRDGYQWVEYGSFGLAGGGGADGNTDWGLGASDAFPVFLYGYSSGMSVAPSEMWGDNFSLAGSVAP